MVNWRFVKRVMDVTLASAGLLVASPILALTALLVLIIEGRPIFYVSRRHVAADRVARVYKFRSMVRDARSPRYALAARFTRDGYLDIPLTCEAYTPIGRLLERTQIVELPQLVNVVMGSMSLIGNRPLPAENAALLQARHPEAVRRFESPAGMSGVAQLVGKLNLAPEQRLALELAYSDLYRTGNVVRCDVLVFFFTLRVLCGGEGITLDQARWMLAPVTLDRIVLPSTVNTSAGA
jgi:lipopolysaccharide/colanic/teichoic acid biosynthesis glycosyltransferase